MSAFLVFCVVVLAQSGAPHAQALTLPDGKFASLSEYLSGTWKWERQEPRQTVIMKFEGNGAFYFNNLTIDLQHWGKYVVSDGNLKVIVSRSCSNQSRNCEDRNPPLDLDYPLTPASAGVFMSNAEKWERQK
ncbi:MAG: hypothetical protein JOY81_09965 [Alphaproteobacteria bacterium]|nr:hypothetical protein [Alphaproteobacteria bacterium]